MKKPLVLVVSLIAAIIGGAISKTVVKEYFDSRMESKVEAALRQAEVQINSTAPKMVDAETRLDGATAGPGRRLKYGYTVVRYKASEIDMNSWRNQVAPDIKRNVRNAEGMRYLFEIGTTVTYRYSGSDGVFVDEIVVTPGEVIQK